MNEVVAGLVVPDGYTDAATLGPEAGTMTGADITCKRADVLMQFAVEEGGGAVWLENREYPMSPGSKHATNICGVRFRNRIAGDPAIIDASLTGPSQPILSPLQHLAATGIGDPLLTLAVASTTPQTFGPFDIGDWPYLLLGVDISGAAGGGGARLSARYPIPNQQVASVDQAVETLLIPSSAAWVGGSAQRALRVVPNVFRQVNIQLDQGPNPVTTSIYVAPCGFPRAALWEILGQPNQFPNILASINQNVTAGQTVNWLVPPWDGKGFTVFAAPGGTNSGPWNVSLSSMDYQGNIHPFGLFTQTGLPSGGSVAFGNAARYTFEHTLVPSPMILQVTNTGQNAGAFQAIIAVEENG